MEDVKLAEQNKEVGMRNSSIHADRVTENWSDKAYKILTIVLTEIAFDKPFMAEDIRLMAKGRLPDPPSNRAWGAVIRRAALNKVIEFVGYAKTMNPKAHRTPAALWKRYE